MIRILTVENGRRDAVDMWIFVFKCCLIRLMREERNEENIG